MRRRYLLYTNLVLISGSLLLYLSRLNLAKQNIAYYESFDGIDKESVSYVAGDAAQSTLRVIYNRVPKCGSRSIVALIETLSAKNGFTAVNSSKNYPYALEENEQKNISDLISSLEPPFLYHRHMNYLDVARLGNAPVAYINLIRDPVSRAVSHFYFRRHGDSFLAGRRVASPIDEKTRALTYDHCVLTNHSECKGNWGQFFIVPFFCGHAPKCRSMSRWALEEAKKCVVKKYLVVGVVEEVDDFIKVLEKLLPNFFKGAYEAWKAPDTTISTVTMVSKTRNKKRPSEKAIAVARARMSLEYEFYDFVKARFHALKKKLNIQKYYVILPK